KYKCDSHGLRVGRLLPPDAPPVATTLRPFGANSAERSGVGLAGWCGDEEGVDAAEVGFSCEVEFGKLFVDAEEEVAVGFEEGFELFEGDVGFVVGVDAGF